MKLKSVLIAAFLFTGIAYQATAQHSSAVKTEISSKSFVGKIDQFQKETDLDRQVQLINVLKADMRTVMADAKAAGKDNEVYANVYNKIQMLQNQGVNEKTELIPLFKEFAELLK